ncbi:MAG: RNA polymerase factor sigma-54 [Chlamydiota bacterium]
MPPLNLKLGQDRRLIMTFALRQALEILQMPQLELGMWLRTEIEQNPLLELDPEEMSEAPHFKSHLQLESQIASPITLYENLLSQIRENFSFPLDCHIAKSLLDHLDERGFITTPLEPIAQFFNQPLSRIESVLALLQTFDPPGICAQNLQQTFLIQLKRLGKMDSLAFQLVRECFDDLLHGRYSLIKKKMEKDDLSVAIQMLARLHFRPSDSFKQECAHLVVPDLQIDKIEETWTIELNETEIPKFHIQEKYMTLKADSFEEKESLKTLKTSAKWIIRSLSRRQKLLRKVAHLLVCKQSAYLEQSGPLVNLALRELSESLQIHESTLSRAIQGKYAATPRGVIPLRSLISVSPKTESAKEILEKLIGGEDKEHPLTDDQLAQELKGRGLPVARRTIAKYRTSLKIGSASQRKNLY